jgi:hypothetical protein
LATQGIAAEDNVETVTAQKANNKRNARIRNTKMCELHLRSKHVGLQWMDSPEWLGAEA